MQLGYSEDHQMLSDTLERFIANEYPFDVRDKTANSEAGHSSELWEQFAELGIIGALFDETAGGFGGTGVDISLVFEQVGRGIVAEPFLAVLLGGSCLACGSAVQQAVLEEVIAGARIVTLAHDEPNTGFEPASVTTTARSDGNGWVLDGEKIVVPFGGVADDIVVSARTDDGKLALFLVAADTPGLARESYNTVDGGTSANVRLEGVRVAGDAMIGAADDGEQILAKALRRGTLALSAEALGVMAVTSDLTLDYLRDRKQFGVPIGSFQALQHRMAEVVIGIEQARSAVVNAASAFDDDEQAAARTLSAAKYTTGRTGQKVAEEAIQMHGGNGMIWEVPVAHYAKRLVLIDHQLGDQDYHLQRYIALGDAGAGA